MLLSLTQAVTPQKRTEIQKAEKENPEVENPYEGKRKFKSRKWAVLQLTHCGDFHFLLRLRSSPPLLSQILSPKISSAEAFIGIEETKKMSSTQCFENPPTLSSSSTTDLGVVQEIAGLSAYVTGPAGSNRAVLLISDVFGYKAPILRKLADKVAAAGYLVVVPDFFFGDPIVKFDDPNFDRESWRSKHGTDKGCEDARSVIADLRSKGVTSIGAAGFCWGGVVVVKLAKFDDIQAGVVLHPGRLTVDDINGIKVPVSILGAEIDHASPPEQLKEFGEILSAKSGIDSFVKIFPGVTHGWSVRYNLDDESAVRSAEEAQADMLNWFIKHVK
ncbi:hypothetical protein Dimus_001449 [Dionaea muscipula]